MLQEIMPQVPRMYNIREQPTKTLIVAKSHESSIKISWHSTRRRLQTIELYLRQTANLQQFVDVAPPKKQNSSPKTPQNKVRPNEVQQDPVKQARTNL
ncbi:hypothetical protein F8M41_015690 [Gigaspora margarita]|uniref:Uncharacterized protein n=1 Tax=Gigaspora margarita TaxID=4874 RepID=A0A8H3ZZ83_GIGMA|nr:hypothetical protein F8M41_015690 [Gigaspora margarita]